MKNISVIILLLIFSVSVKANVHIGSGQTFGNIEAAHNASAIHPGDTVYLHEGAFTGYQGISKLKGDSLNWIVIMPFKDDSTVINGCWQFMSCEYVKLVNLNFVANAQYTGRLLNVDNSGSCETQSKYIIIDSCHFEGVTDANAITSFKFGGVDFFEVTNCTFKNMSSCSAFDFNVCHYGLIRGNRIENCLTGGHIKGGASNITMDRNIFVNSAEIPWVAFELGGDTGEQFYCPGDNFEVKSLNFYSNIIIGGYRGLALSSAIDCNVINNTFYNCGQATLRFLTTSNLYPATSGNKVQNNIFAFGESAYINGSPMTSGAAIVSNNIYYSIINFTFNGPYWDTPELDKIKESNPLIFGSDEIMFVNGTKNDFHLLEGSPAIGSALTVSEPLTDFYGNPFSTVSRSIGAIEFVPSIGIKENAIFGDINISPNPASDYIEIKLSESFKLSESCEIKIYNTSGVCVSSVVVHFNMPLLIDISVLPTGFYYLRIKDKFYKFVKL